MPIDTADSSSGSAQRAKSKLLRSSAPIFVRFLLLDFIFISSCWMTKPDDGGDGKPAFTQPHSAQSRERTNSHWWIGCLCLFAILWFRVLWASASVIEVATIPTLKWLLTLGLISLIFLVLFIAILSRLSLARRAPAEPWSVTPIHILSYWSTLRAPPEPWSVTPYIFCLTGLPCSPVPWWSAPSITSPCTGVLEYCGPFAYRVSVCSKVGTLACDRAGPKTWIASIMVTVCCAFTALNWVCYSCCLCTLFSFNNIKLHSLSISYPAKLLPGVLLLYGSLVYNMSSLVSFLLMKPYPFLSLDHFIVPKTFLEMTFLSPPMDADHVRPPGPPLLAPLLVEPGLVSVALRAAEGGEGSCWISASLLMVAVMVTVAGCGSSGCDDDQAGGGGGALRAL